MPFGSVEDQLIIIDILAQPEQAAETLEDRPGGVLEGGNRVCCIDATPFANLLALL